MLACGLLAGGLFAAATASAAHASGGGGGPLVPMAFFGLPSVESIVEGIVNFFFTDLAKALVPSFLKHASVATVKWLVALPDPTAWPHVAVLQGDIRTIGFSLLSVSFTAGIVRHMLIGLTGAEHPLQALGATVTSAGILVCEPWATRQTIALVNTLTDAVLSLPVVGEGLTRTVGVMFGGALLVGSGGVFLAVLVIAGVIFAVVMFMLKVFVTLALTCLYVAGPLVIALRPLPELSHLARALGSALLGIVFVPVAWTILFAVAGALSLDATTFGSGGAGGLSGQLAAAFAALITFYLACKLPLGALGHVRGVLSTHALTGPGRASRSRTTSGGRGRNGGGGGAVRSVADANARLLSGSVAAGRAVGRAAGALGAPKGGPAGVAARSARRLAGPVAGTLGGTVGGMLAASRLAQGARRTAGRASHSKPGSALRRSLAGRIAAAGRELSPKARQARGPATPTPAQRNTPPNTTSTGASARRSESKRAVGTPGGASPSPSPSRSQPARTGPARGAGEQQERGTGRARDTGARTTTRTHPESAKERPVGRAPRAAAANTGQRVDGAARSGGASGPGSPRRPPRPDGQHPEVGAANKPSAAASGPRVREPQARPARQPDGQVSRQARPRAGKRAKRPRRRPPRNGATGGETKG